MAENKTSWIFDLDVKDATEKLLKVQGQVEQLGDAKNLQGLIDGMQNVAKTAGILYIAYETLKKVFELSVEGEAVNAINNQFEILAKNAGIAGETIKEKLVAASGGLADDTDILKAANEQIVKLGANAQKLPQVMELARKVTQVFGGELIGNFEGISTAVANGNTRMLKQYGILVDADKAMLAYAKSIGTTVGALSEAGKQQALMNAVLEKGEQSFKGVDTEAKPLAASVTQIKVAFGQMYETIALWVNKSGAVQNTFKVLAEMIKGTANSLKEELGQGAEKSEAQIFRLNKELKDLETNLDNAKKGNEGWLSKIFGGADTELIQKRIEDVKKQIAAATEEKEKLEREQPKREVASESKPAATTGIDLEKQRAQRTEFERSLQEMRSKSLEMQEQNAMSIEEADKLHAARKLMIEQEYQNQRSQLEQQVTQGKMTRQQADMLEEQVEEQKKQKLVLYDQELEKKRMDSLKRYAERNKETAEGFKGAWAAAAADAGARAKNFSSLGTSAFTILKTNGISMFKALGDGSKSAGDAMRGFMFSSLGDIAEAKGEILLEWGLGELNPLAIAKGGALIAIGSMLKSQGGGGGGGLSASGGGGGGGGGYAGAPESALPESKPTVQEPKKAVSINIHGSYYETEQTKTRLMEMIREVSDATDFSFKQIGQ